MGHWLSYLFPVKLLNDLISCMMFLTYFVVSVFLGSEPLVSLVKGKIISRKQKNPQTCSIITARSALHGFITFQNPKQNLELLHSALLFHGSQNRGFKGLFKLLGSELESLSSPFFFALYLPLVHRICLPVNWGKI